MADTCKACGNSGMRILRAGEFAGSPTLCPVCHPHPETFGEAIERVYLAYEALEASIRDAVRDYARRVRSLVLGTGKE